MRHYIKFIFFLSSLSLALSLSGCVSQAQFIYVRPAEDGQMHYHIEPTHLRETNGKLTIDIDMTYRMRDSTVTEPTYVNFTLHDPIGLKEVTGLSIKFADGTIARAVEFRRLSRNLIRNEIRMETTMPVENFQMVLDKIDTTSIVCVTYNSTEHSFPVTKTLSERIKTAKKI